MRLKCVAGGEAEREKPQCWLKFTENLKNVLLSSLQIAPGHSFHLFIKMPSEEKKPWEVKGGGMLFKREASVELLQRLNLGSV
jgi:hypothetical protein